jgi:1,4-alpha-glucan branching enzyme
VTWPPWDEAQLGLIEQGRHGQLWRVLGAQPDPSGTGVWFSVWAPRAAAVRVETRDAETALERLPRAGVWGGYVRAARPGDPYGYRILGADGQWRSRADPMARQTVFGQPWRSVVPDPRAYRWRWPRPARCEPRGIYELHLGSWRPGLGYRRAIPLLVGQVKRAGFSHVELLPLTEHPYGGSWGYQVSSYFAPTARWGRPDDLRALIDALHGAGIGVLLDWVPAHFAVDAWSLAGFDGAPLYEHPDPQRGDHPAWGTKVFHYADPRVRDFLVSSARFWLEEFQVDGLRVDAVSSIARRDFLQSHVDGPPEDEDGLAFLRELTTRLRIANPDALLIAEEAGLTPGVTEPVAGGGLGFDRRWDLGWAHDVLFGVGQSTVDGVAAAIDRAAAGPVVLPLSHDEVARESLWQRCGGSSARLRALLALAWASPGVPLLFMGGELGQREPWRENASLAWAQADRGVLRLVARLHALYRGDPEPVTWLARSGHVLAFTRGARLCVANLGPATRWPLPAGCWRVELDTDECYYGGNGAGHDADSAGHDAGGAGHDAGGVEIELAAESVVWLADRDISSGVSAGLVDHNHG